MSATRTVSKRVLVVDDERAVADLLAQLLVLDGYKAETAPSARVALSQLEQAQYDLIISDLRMPEVDGLGFFREVERRQAEGRPPFIFMTGEILSAEALRFFEMTKTPCLRKPFLLDDIRRAILLALGQAA